MVCPGYAKSVSHGELLLLKNAKVNWHLGFNDVCNEKHVIVAYNNRPTFNFNKTTGKMVKWPVANYLQNYVSIAWEWEIQAVFFETYNIKPTWVYANQNWGTLNYTTGQWSGAVGMIQRDEVDYALLDFAATYARSKVAAFSPGTQYRPLHLLTRYPLELPPTWNLLGLFTKGYISRMSFL